MGSRVELLSGQGLRVDGRRANELRKLTCRMGLDSVEADGSAYVEQGNSKCLVSVFGPRETKFSAHAIHDKARLTVEYNLATFSGGERRKRNRTDRTLLESAQVIRQSFEPVILLSFFPRSEITISIQMLQVDGSDLSVAINATTLALIDAGIPMIDYVVASTSGWFQDTALLDLNHIEESQGVPFLTCGLLPKSGKMNVCTLEGSRLHVSNFEAVAEMALDGCHSIKNLLDAQVRASTLEKAKTCL